MPRTGAATRAAISEAEPQSVLDWFRDNTRLLVIGAVIVVAAALGFWFYSQSRRIRIERAEQTLMSAQQALAQNNVALAQTDLQTIVTRWPGTPAGTQAAMVLARIHYEAGRYQEGIQVLERITDAGAADAVRPAIESLIADGYMELNQPAEAAEHYRVAAEETRFEADRDVYLSQAARALVAATDTAAAVEIWRELANDPESAVSAEAKVRLGELTVEPIRQS